MVATTPFQVVTASVSGKSLILVSGSSGASIGGTLDSTGGYAPSFLVTNQGPNSAWVRMSAEASPTATQNDIPMLPNTVRLFTNPVPIGKAGIAVTVSVTTSPNTVFVTPGTGGI